jgi:DNA-binding CsgD family transcriptional regulator
MHDHHIVFRSQGGLDLQANMTELSYEQHLGNKSPHRDREVDISLKTDLQNTYYNLFSNDNYSIKEIAEILKKSEKYIFKHFRKVKNFAGIYQKEDIIRKLMGGKLY